MSPKIWLFGIGLCWAGYFLRNNSYRRNSENHVDVPLLWGKCILTQAISICEGVCLSVPGRGGRLTFRECWAVEKAGASIYTTWPGFRSFSRPPPPLTPQPQHHLLSLAEDGSRWWLVHLRKLPSFPGSLALYTGGIHANKLLLVFLLLICFLFQGPQPRTYTGKGIVPTR